MPKTDDLAAWRTFLAFAKAGTVAQAAAALQIEPSNVSRAIAALERSLGCELVRHSTRPLRLTEAGELAVKRMEPLLRAHASLISDLTSEARALEGNIKAALV